jgi:hypothetical protein
VYKVVRSIWIWPVAETYRATTRLLIFDSSNKYLGEYFLESTAHAPDTIMKNSLVFRNTKSHWRDGDECDPKLVTRISFDNGLPKEFFRKCSKDKNGKAWGDFYVFETTKF